MTTANPPRIAFISHTTPDDSYVAELASFLLASGFEQVFNDVSAIKPDEQLWPTIEQGIRDCTTFYVVIGGKTNDSVWVQREVACARSLNKPIVPVRIDDGELPLIFAGRDVVDFRTRNRKSPDQRIADSKLVTRHTADKLFGRDTELAVLDAAWNNQDTINIQCVIAWGGVGKTALLAHWVQTRFRNRGWKNSAGQPEPLFYFDWTFYDQGTRASDATHAGAASIGTFFTEALRHFGDPEPENPDRKAERLAKLVQAHRNLIVLDGLEPLQYPHNHPQAGQLTDPDLAQFLRLLAQKNPGLCLISSREALSDLGGHLSANAPHHDLDDLPTEAAIGLLRNLNVTGSDADLTRAVEDYHHHALSLILLGRFLATARGGDIRQRDTVSFSKADNKRDAQTRSAWHVLETYEQWLGSSAGNSADLQALRLIGLFDRPATPGCLQALRQAPAISGLTDHLISLDPDDWNALLNRLHQAHLIQLRFPSRDLGSQAPQPEPRTVPVDAHPLIREYFARQLRDKEPQGYQTAHARLFEYLCASAEYQPDTLDALQPLYQAVVHGCLAGRQQQASDDVYRDRILRGTGDGGFYSMKRLGAIGADLGAVTAFFETPWSCLSSNLSEPSQAWLLNEAASRLRALGRLTEAAEPMRVSGEMDAKTQRWEWAALSYSNLSQLEVTLGELEPAVANARRAIAFADRIDPPDLIPCVTCRTTAADALHQRGRKRDERNELNADEYDAAEADAVPEARQLFEQAEALQRDHQPEFELLYSLRGFKYCDLILAPAERAAWQRCLLAAREKSISPSAGQATQFHTMPLEPNPAELLLEPESTAVSRTVPPGKPFLSLTDQVEGIALADAERRAAKTVAWTIQYSMSLLSFAMGLVTIARVALYRAQLDPQARAAFTSQPARTALEALRKANTLDHLPKALLTAAASHHIAGDTITARQLLAEAQQIAERGPMPLYLADVHLHRARLVGSMNAADRQEHWPGVDPKAELAKARALIEKHHYGRRFDELADAEAASVHWS